MGSEQAPKRKIKTVQSDKPSSDDSVPTQPGNPGKPWNFVKFNKVPGRKI